MSILANSPVDLERERDQRGLQEIPRNLEQARLRNLPAYLDRERILDSKQTSEFLNISLAHFRRLYRAQKVPAPIQIGYRKYGWQAGVLIDFVTAKSGQAA
jgi:predicted DNA-binding transcriptional regulator AlpA